MTKGIDIKPLQIAPTGKKMTLTYQMFVVPIRGRRASKTV